MKPAVKPLLEHNFSLVGLHLPERKHFTRNLEKVSFYLNDFVLVTSILSLCVFALNITFFKNFLFGFFVFPPMVAVLFLLIGTTLFFSAKYYNSSLQKTSISSKVIPIFFSGMSIAISLLSIIDHFWGSQIPPMVGFNFLLLGLAVMLPHLHVTHRFHITQLLTSAVLIINAINILGYIYQLLFYSFKFATPLIPIPFSIGLITTLLCYSILFRWFNRGFLGNFSIDCLSSMFALRLLVINFLIMPIIGFLTLFLTKNENNIYTIVALLVLLLTAVAATLAWFNMKLLYRYELEHFAMKEALRVHSIKLMLDKKTQQVKLSSLEEEKKEYTGKLNNRDKFSDVIDNLGS